ncbi:MAG: Ig-like domain-containing protein [Oscillospiraceae bacterium]|nr:Ig-like domain-containing protein [Oscillospiraceae bacterium]MDD4414243.1 Ig-like domain-containing protein [Oscillospiraceae bacterium]
MLKKKYGFTLIEVIISLSIASMISLTLVSLISVGSQINIRSNDLGRAQSLAESYLSVLDNQLKFATSMNIESDAPSNPNDEQYYIYLSDGDIYLKPRGSIAEPIIPQTGNNDFSYDISFSPVNKHVLRVELAIKKQDKQVYSMNSEIHIVNLMSKSITGDPSGECVSYNLLGLPVSSIIIDSPGSYIDSYAELMQMTAKVYPTNAADKGVAWSVDNTDLATIDQDGLLTPLSNGTVTVTATALDGSGVTATKQIIINSQMIPITSLSLTAAAEEISPGGKTLQIIPIIWPDNATNKKLNWSVSDDRYGTIDSNGLFTTKDMKNKTVVITAKATDGSNQTDTIRIRINNDY